MIEILFWVRRVSQINRVSSKNNPEKILAIFCVATVAISILAFGAVSAPAYASDITIQKVIGLANADRREKGVGDLVENEKLARAAMAKAEDMIADDYFSHTAPDRATPWHWIEKENYDYNYAGENLAMDFVSVEKMNKAWLASSTHRANILNEKYKEIGVAVKEGIINGNKTIVVVQIFGSGDKNMPVPEKKNVETREQKQEEEKIVIPKLPISEENGQGNNSFFFNKPVITSPQSGESMPSRTAEVFGRAKPGSKISLFDRGELVAVSLSDDKGWFKAKISNLEEGEHVFKTESEIIAGGKKEIHVSKSDVGFVVDATRPKIEYQLFATESQREVAIKVRSNKPNCVFEVGPEKTFASSGKFIHVFPKQDWLSVSLKVEDEAGNKAFGEVNLSGYYFQPNNGFDIVGIFASAMASQKVFAAESGREAVRNNLGLAPHQFLSSRLTDEH